MCRGNKVITGGEKRLFYFLTRELFSYSLLFLLAFIFKRRNWGGEEEGNVKIDEGYRGTICVSTCESEADQKGQSAREMKDRG